MSKQKTAVPSQKTVRDVLALAHDVRALAHEMGLTALNPQEKHLIELLRFTTYHGCNLVIETAIAMRRAYPWVDDQYASNTQSIHPADGRFFVPEKE